MLQEQKPVDTELHLWGRVVVETFDFLRVLADRMFVAELARVTNDLGNRILEQTSAAIRR